ncbi:hypothetical protein ACXDSS_004458 [Klebsiella quasipneumoniae]
MKKLLFSVLLISAFTANADCHGSWDTGSYTQNINTYTVVKKTHFYALPNEGSKANDLFLIKGDEFSGFLQSNGFEFGYFTKKDRSIVSGWIKQSDLAEKSPHVKSDKEISDSDFIIYTPFKSIVLGSSYDNFNKAWGACGKSEQNDTGLWSNTVTIGDKDYKYFDYHWKWFSIRASNINYETAGNDFDTYRVTSISVNGNGYMTSRGVSVGMSIGNIKNAYGEPVSVSKDEITYTHSNYELDFVMDGKKIKSIKMEEQAQ